MSQSMNTKGPNLKQVPPPASPEGADAQKEQQIPIDGYGQIYEMLRIADPAFRESLLKRLAGKDKKLALQLQRDLSNK